jgi:dihydrofolate reductase
MTIDGYIARLDGGMDFLAMDAESEAIMAEFFAGIDVTIMGRKTAAAALKQGGIPETPGVTSYVFSRRWKAGKREGFQVVNGPVAEFVKKLKRRPGKDIYVTGGGIARSFLREDLVDELFIGLGPALLGAGIPAFPAGFPQRDFRLAKCKSYANGSVELRYQRVRTKTAR